MLNLAATSPISVPPPAAAAATHERNAAATGPARQDLTTGSQNRQDTGTVPHRMQPGVLAVAVLVLISLSVAASATGLRSAIWLPWLGAGLGLCLYRSGFGFTSGFRALLRDGDSTHFRAQLLLLGLATALFFPALEAGTVLGQPVGGFVLPMGVALLAGAFVFGIGMQIGGGCGSGTLYTVGGGSLRMVITLIAFIAGATLAAYSFPLWGNRASLAPVSLTGSLGLWGALALQLGFLGALWVWSARRERRRFGMVQSIWTRTGASLLRGPWPHAWSAIGLAVLAFATLVAAGRPWGITQSFALWGSKMMEAAHLDDPHFWAFWEDPQRVDLIHRAVLGDTTSVMNFGLVAGAMVAATLAGAFRPQWRLSGADIRSAVLGGLLLGFGAILATGCNIGAFLSGVASGSLHGWVWLVAALAGNVAGLWLRPYLGLSAPPPSPR